MQTIDGVSRALDSVPRVLLGDSESNFASLRLDKGSTGLFQQASGMAVLFCLVSPLLRIIIISQAIAILISIPIWEQNKF
jgi:hypothetical protein